MTNIVQKDTKEGKVLREIAKEVSPKEIGTSKLSKILQDMRIALEGEDDGVALAASQIGISKKIFVVSPRVFIRNPDEMQLVFINPEIIKISSDRKLIEEGCLSVRWWYGKTRRASLATIKALDEDGNEFTLKGKGLLAQIFQHEVDHLNGILFSDHAKKLIEIEPPKKDEK